MTTVTVDFPCATEWDAGSLLTYAPPPGYSLHKQIRYHSAGINFGDSSKWLTPAIMPGTATGTGGISSFEPSLALNVDGTWLADQRIQTHVAGNSANQDLGQCVRANQATNDLYLKVGTHSGHAIGYIPSSIATNAGSTYSVDETYLPSFYQTVVMADPAGQDAEGDIWQTTEIFGNRIRQANYGTGPAGSGDLAPCAPHDYNYLPRSPWSPEPSSNFGVGYGTGTNGKFFIESGNFTTLAQLQAINGTLLFVIGGVTYTVTVNCSSDANINAVKTTMQAALNSAGMTFAVADFLDLGGYPTKMIITVEQIDAVFDNYPTGTAATAAQLTEATGANLNNVSIPVFDGRCTSGLPGMFANGSTEMTVYEILISDYTKNAVQRYIPPANGGPVL